MKYYIENLGSQTLGDQLMELQTAGMQISEHPQTTCLDRRGNKIARNLYEVPKNIIDRLYRMARSSGFQFAIYRQISENLPKEYYSVVVPLINDAFKDFRSRRGRRKLAISSSGVFPRFVDLV